MINLKPELIEKILNYLAKKPYYEVAHLIAEITTSTQKEKVEEEHE